MIGLSTPIRQLRLIILLGSLVVCGLGCVSRSDVAVVTPTHTTNLPAEVTTASKEASFSPSPSLSPIAIAVSTPGNARDESTLVLAAPHSAAYYPEILNQYRQWAQSLSNRSGLHVTVLAAPATEMELLQELASGRIVVAMVNPLTFMEGRERGWLQPAATSVYHGQAGYAIMFVARRDTGLVAGEPPYVLQQLTDRRPCWPSRPSPSYPPVEEFLLPAGLLAQHNVTVGQPVFVEDTLSVAVFQGKCDFAIEWALGPQDFLSLLPSELSESGVTFERWEQEMQVLYVTPMISPHSVLVFSPQVPEAERERLTEAILRMPSPQEGVTFRAFDNALYESFTNLVEASGIPIEPYLSQPWWLPDPAEALPDTWVKPPTDTLVIDVMLQGGTPFLPDSSDPLNRLVLPAIYAELLRLDADGQWQPYLAQEVPTLENGLVRFVGSGEDKQLEVEYRLRPNLRWHDGTPLTATDLAFSWALVMQPDWPGQHAGAAGWAAEVYVASVEAPALDRVSYRFMSQRQVREAAQTGERLNNPAPYATLTQHNGPVVPLDYLDVGRNVFPQHLLKEIPPNQIPSSSFAQHPVYAGAYRLVEAEGRDSPVVLEAFEEFALGVPSVKRIVFGARYYSGRATPNWQPPNQLRDALEVGAIHAQLTLPALFGLSAEGDPRAYDALAQEGIAGVMWVPQAHWEQLLFNLDNPHLADVRVRRAIAYALDREVLVTWALEGHGEAIDSFLPVWHPLYAGNDSLPEYPYNSELSRTLLQEAGYDTTQRPATHPTRGSLVLRLAITSTELFSRDDLALQIKEQLAVIGIQVDIQHFFATEFSTDGCTSVLGDRRFDLLMDSVLGSTSLYPYRWAERMAASNRIPNIENGCPANYTNWAGWRNTRVDEILPHLADGYFALEQPQMYRQQWIELQQLWMSELPSLPLFNLERPIVLISNLIGVQPSPFAFGYGVEDTWNSYQWNLR